MPKSLSLSAARASWRNGSEQSPYLVAMFSGGAIGIGSAAAAALCLLIMEALLPKALWGPSAAAALSEYSNAALFFMAVLFAPFFETFIAQLLPLEIARRVGFGVASCIMVGGILFALGHFHNGGLAHGIGAGLAGLFFSGAYMLMRPRGYLIAYLSSWSAHMMHNALLLFALQ